MISSSGSSMSYANVTIRSGPLSAVIFLPQGVKPDEPTYYNSSRFDWSSNIASISRTTTTTATTTQGKDETDATATTTTHVLFGTDLWRQPHDPTDTEAGVGLAAEFGVGDDGSFCNFQCGWRKDNEVTNGVLGYDNAAVGDAFLKIGVGALIKGSCPDCDITSVYRFNSEYEFAHPPVWTLVENGDGQSIRLTNEETLREFGYRIQKDITINDHQLRVKTTLTNIGRVPMSTAWYSHNFFTCDNQYVGPGYSVDLDLPSGGDFTEPGFMIWSSPIDDYASISRQHMDETTHTKVVEVNVERPIEEEFKLKAEFARDDASHGGFTLHGCDTKIHESFPEVGTTNGPTLYGFNLYMERSTLSPEVQLFLHLSPGETESWTQQLDFSDDDNDDDTSPHETEEKQSFFLSSSSSSVLRSVSPQAIHGRESVRNGGRISIRSLNESISIMVVVTGAILLLWVHIRRTRTTSRTSNNDYHNTSQRRRRSLYDQIE